MSDSPAVRSAQGHVETLEWLIARHREKIEKGEAVPDAASVERWIEAEELRLAEWRRTFERALLESKTAPPLV